MNCAICGGPTHSRTGVCTRRAACLEEHRRRHDQARNERILAGGSERAVGAHYRGRRTTALERDALNGEITGDALEFVLAVDAARRRAGGFLKTTQIYQVLLDLGYRKVPNP